MSSCAGEQWHPCSGWALYPCSIKNHPSSNPARCIATDNANAKANATANVTANANAKALVAVSVVVVVVVMLLVVVLVLLCWWWCSSGCGCRLQHFCKFAFRECLTDAKVSSRIRSSFCSRWALPPHRMDSPCSLGSVFPVSTCKKHSGI